MDEKKNKQEENRCQEVQNKEALDKQKVVDMKRKLLAEAFKDVLMKDKK